MGGRLALVVGSECVALGELGFTAALAGELYGGLRRSGGWSAATGTAGPVLNPTAAELVSVMDEAFRVASEQRATLLVAFIGHGVATGAGDFFLLAHDSPAVPRSHNAFHLAQGIRERLNESRLDGLIVLIDACETEQGLRGAATRWTDLLADAAGRMELLVASGAGPAYSGCFTRTVLATFDTGLPLRGETLLAHDLVDPIARSCRLQEPQHLSFTAGTVAGTAGGDPGLWLVPNAARRRDALTGRPAAGLLDQLTRDVVVTDALRESLIDLVESGGRRLRAVVGPAGSGKSTLLALLIRPSVAEGLPIAPEYVTAAVFLTASSSLEIAVGELAEQLSDRLPGYAQAARVPWAGAGEPDIFELELAAPLARLRRVGQRITLVFDGLDLPEPGSRDLLIDAVAELTERPELAHVRVIVGVRAAAAAQSDPRLAHMHPIAITGPGVGEIAAEVQRGDRPAHSADTGYQGIDYMGGDLGPADDPRVPAGWLLAKLLRELHPRVSDRLSFRADIDTLAAQRLRLAEESAAPEVADAIGRMVAILVAAGVGPVLPIEVLEAALAEWQRPLHSAGIRDAAVGLGALLTRSRPGTADEALGIAHDVLLAGLAQACDALQASIEDAHTAILLAIRTRGGERSEAYARAAGARHYLAGGDGRRAVDHLVELETVRAADNRDMWAAWVPSIAAAIGDRHPDTLRAREYLATRRADSGDFRGAVADYERVLADEIAIFGAEHRNTLSTRYRLAAARGEIRDPAGAAAELEDVLADQRRVLGADDPDTLRTRSKLAALRAIQGDLAGAIAETEELLAIRRRVLGPAHPETLATRGNLAGYRVMGGDSATTVDELQGLLAEQLGVLASDDPRVLLTRAKLATARARGGDTAGAIAAGEVLLADQVRVLGPEDSATLRTRADLAGYRARGGDLDAAIQELYSALTERIKVLGPDHREILYTRGNLAYLRANNGDPHSGLREARLVLADQVRLLGHDHPDTFVTRGNLAAFRAKAGQVAAAESESRALLADQLRVLGPDHPQTLLTRNNLAAYRARNGDVPGAVAELTSLLADRERILGPDHPDTAQTRKNLAHWHSRLDA
ncbi:tetratricopeptide repeat protein [Nocardia brasiliensis]|uniref:tetratricopeptide repeat protein n=1 Tax=Nocardia brasiliensis TaxID=37326 RepID=UPI00189490C6|nr:tetratricopeptide repeat protein [Nocardia brasiliensis]MBF6130570.1 tetratricopeptide repeat protein [Nocardia brasiliensis]